MNFKKQLAAQLGTRATVKTITATTARELEESNYFNDKFYDFKLMEVAFKDTPLPPSEEIGQNTPADKAFNKAVSTYEKLFAKKVAAQKKLADKNNKMRKDLESLENEKAKIEEKIEKLENDVAELRPQFDDRYAEDTPFTHIRKMVVKASALQAEAPQAQTPSTRDLLTLAHRTTRDPQVKQLLARVLGADTEECDTTEASRPAAKPGTVVERSNGHRYIKTKDGKWKKVDKSLHWYHKPDPSNAR